MCVHVHIMANVPTCVPRLGGLFRALPPPEGKQTDLVCCEVKPWLTPPRPPPKSVTIPE